MRLLSFALAGVCLVASNCLFAAAISTEEAAMQKEFNKAYNNPDKTARKSAISMLEGAKHSTSWQLAFKVATSDPDPEVRLAAYTVLAKEPAHDTSVAHMLVQIFSALKFNDTQARIDYAKAMAPSEFKYELSSVLADSLSKMRYPDIPKYFPGTGTGINANGNALQIENVKKVRATFEALLEAFNGVAKSDVTTATKDSPNTVMKWLAANQAALVKADRDLADKYKKEDAEAAKAAAEAAKKP